MASLKLSARDKNGVLNTLGINRTETAVATMAILVLLHQVPKPISTNAAQFRFL